MNTNNQPNRELVGDYCCDLDQQTFNYYDIISPMFDYFRLFKKFYNNFKHLKKNKLILLVIENFEKRNKLICYNTLF